MDAAEVSAQATGCVRVLDAGALIALDRGDRDTWGLIADAHRRGFRPAVPAPIIAQAWRGGARQARLARALNRTEQVPIDGELAFRAGALLARAGTDDVLDALVALLAADRPGWEVLTSDPDDINHLLSTLKVSRAIRRV